MRLLFGGLLDFEVGHGLAQLAFDVIATLLELPQALTDCSSEFGKLLRAKEQHHDHKNEDDLWPSGHTEGDWKVHLATNYNEFTALQRNLIARPSARSAGGVALRRLARKSLPLRLDRS